jgi:hypothetical protein
MRVDGDPTGNKLRLLPLQFTWWRECTSCICILDMKPDVAFTSTLNEHRPREPMIRSKAFIGTPVLNSQFPPVGQRLANPG